MYVKKITLENFRGLSKIDVELDEHLNVIVGVNGVGKSAILDALAIMLSTLTERIRGNAQKARQFSPEDIRSGSQGLSCSIYVDFMDELTAWSMARNFSAKNKLFHSELENLNELVGSFLQQVNRDPLTDNVTGNIPLAVYYNVHRSVIDPPMRVRDKSAYSALSAYDNALQAVSDFNEFFKWFRKQEDLENETRRDDSQYRDHQLEAVRQAIENFMPGFTDLRVRRNPVRMSVRKSGEELDVKQLSDGEKCLLALVGDLARRLVIANPESDQPLNGDGVVLIDEIDLHLHPSLQRQVLNKLRDTFKNCQFIVSTHSPQILSHVKAGNVWLLKRREQGIEAVRPTETYGLDSNALLEIAMETPERDSVIKTRLENLFQLIEDNQLAEANSEINAIVHEVNDLPELSRARAILRRKEMLNG